MFKPGKGILTYLKSQKKGINLPFDVLRQFQEFEKAWDKGLKSYEGLEKEVTYGMQTYTKIEMLATTLILSGEYPAVLRCHEDLMKRYKKDTAFKDGVSLMSWMLFNFPSCPEGRPIAQEIIESSPKLAPVFAPFIDDAINSRLGLYEVVKDNSDKCQLKELFTNKFVTLDQSLSGIETGRIVLVRAMSIMGKIWAFGDTPGFPASKKSALEEMVSRKMYLCFGGDDEKKSYEMMMRLAGPYWFSIVADDLQSDILNPDHYRTYYRN